MNLNINCDRKNYLKYPISKDIIADSDKSLFLECLKIDISEKYIHSSSRCVIKSQTFHSTSYNLKKHQIATPFASNTTTNKNSMVKKPNFTNIIKNICCD